MNERLQAIKQNTNKDKNNIVSLQLLEKDKQIEELKNIINSLKTEINALNSTIANLQLNRHIFNQPLISDRNLNTGDAVYLNENGILSSNTLSTNITFATVSSTLL